MSEQAQRLTQEMTVIDADVHLTIRPEDVARYLEEPYKHGAKEGYIFPNSIWDWSLGGKIGEDRYFEFTDLEAVAAFREEYGIDYPILNTFEPLDKFPSELSVRLMRAYNDLILDKFLDEDDDLVGLAGLSMRRPEQAAAEIERMSHEDQIVGAYIGNSALHPPAGDPMYDVVYRAAEKHDMPIVFHANADDFVRDFPIQNRGFQTYLEVHSVTHLWHQTMTISSLVGQGTVAKFPDLNFVILEAGISWIPYSMFRLNREYSIRRSEAPFLERSPEEYIRDSFYFASQPLGEPNDPEHMQYLIEMIGTDSLMFASDYPHWDFDHPEALDSHLRRHFTEAEARQVLYDTPKEAFGLPV